MWLSGDSIRQLLKSFGLTEKEADIYIFISKHGAVRSMELAKLTRTDKGEVYRVLTGLQSKGIIEKTLESPTRFTSVPFEKLVDSYIKTKRDEANIVESTKNDLIADWKRVAKQLPLSPLERFVVIEGWKKIYPRFFEMIKGSQHELSFVSTADTLLKAEQYGLLDTIKSHPNKRSINFRFIAETSDVNKLEKILKKLSTSFVNFKSKKPELDQKTLPRMVIKDNNEILLFLDPPDKTSESALDIALWTNCKTIIQSFEDTFEELWSTSIGSLEEKNSSTPFSTQQPTICLKKTYIEKLLAAQSEVLMVTSSEGLREFCKETRLIKQLIAKGVTLKIMAPIVRKNYSYAQKFSKYGIVKHVPENYVGVTIIDRKELMQVKTQQSGKKSIQMLAMDKNYIAKMRNTLNNLWNNAQSPSVVTLAEVTGPTLFPMPQGEGFKRAGIVVTDLRPPGEVTEQDIINKINFGKKHEIHDIEKDVNVIYGSAASAIIHPPPHFNLPKLLFIVHHIEKQSSFGEGDALEVHISVNTAKTLDYMAAGGLGDNVKGVAYRKATYAGTPFEENYKLVKKDKLQVRVYGNNLFVGWTVPIPLLPPKYILPPGCLIFEGHGAVKTQAITTVNQAGYRSEVEQNWLEAFVTFMHPQSKYSGPGTDGAFFRDFACKVFPLKSKVSERLSFK
jgi:sugar-specific transcriptional regulator TrmB